MSLPGTAEGLTLLAEYLIKTTAVLSTCLLLLAAMRRSPAAIRHSLLAFFLIGLLLLPAFSTLQFGWETELLPGKAPGTARREPGRPAASGAAGIRAGARLLAAVAGRPQRAESGAAPAPADGFPPADRPLPGFGRLLTLTWFAGLAFLVLRLGLGIAGAGRLTREGAEVTDPDWRGLFARLLAAVRIRKAVRLKSHEAIEIPLTWGWLKPVVLIPARYWEWSEDQRAPALLHELCHIKRGDLFIMFLVRFSLAVYWFNPLCWVAFRRLQQEQERACDELVLTAGVRPSTYAAALLFFKGSGVCRVPAAFLGLFGGPSFQDRLAAILRQKLILKEISMKTRITLAIAALLAVSLAGMARPAGNRHDVPAGAADRAAAPAVLPAAVSAVLPIRTGQEAKGGAKKEQEVKKAEPKREIVIRKVEAAKTPIEITIQVGDSERKIQIPQPVTIKLGKEGEIMLVGPDGKEVEVLKAEPVRLTIEGGDLAIAGAGKTLKFDRKDGWAVLEADRITIERSGAAGTMKIRVDVAGKGGEGRLSILTLPGEQVLKKKIEDLKIQLKPAKVRELTVLQNKKAIQSLRADVVKLDALKNLRTTLADRTRRIAVAMPGGGITKAGRVWIVEGSGRSFTTITGSDGTDISILFHLDPGENSGALYERITARVKQALPENLTLEPKFDAKAGAVTLRLSGSGTKGATTEFIGKLIDAIKSELNAGK